MADTNRKYPFNLPWGAVAVGGIFYAGLVAWMVYLANEYTGFIYICLLAFGLLFGVLGVILCTRRLVFARVLELTDDAIIFPSGFPRTRIHRIAYSKIILLSEIHSGTQTCLQIVTGSGDFEISSSYLPGLEVYAKVREFICSRASIELALQRDRSAAGPRLRTEAPEPILRCKEPDDWPRYRAMAASSKPLLSRLVKQLRFSLYCFGFIVLPWLLLRLFEIPTASAKDYLPLGFAVTAFFTSLYWLSTAQPVHATEIIFRPNGLSWFPGRQRISWNYGGFSGWAIIERQFEDRLLLILLLQWNQRVRPFALPDTATRDRVAQICREKQILHVPGLQPPWE